ncbi:MAG: lantibiotic dehydratase, partial [Gemmatimonadetes bacterium]|nr:lantibiotic dehydratase [Gemmatimonadota bacterium]
MPSTMPAAAGPAYADGGFAVVRTPLLPVEAFLAWSRQMAGALAADTAAEADGPVALEVLREAAADPAFREAVRVASADLSREVDAWLQGRGTAAPRRLVHSLARYFSRAAYRCTPFGLFAGCSLVQTGNRTRLEMSPRCEWTRRSRIDMDHLAELARTLAADPVCRRCVPLRANPSASPAGGRLHYVETGYAGRRRVYRLTAVDPTPEITDTLERARDGATFAALAAPLRAAGYDDDEVEAFLGELLDAQLLVPDLDPLVSGGDAATALADTLEAAEFAPGVSAALREVTARLDALDGWGVGRGPDYDGAVAPLLALGLEANEGRALQVDLFKPAPGASLGPRVLEDAVLAAELLGSIASAPDPLAAFAARFEARYETREVPLLEALDEEVGIGFPSLGAEDGVMRRVAEARAGREAVLGDLRCRAAAAGALEVELTDDDLERLRPLERRPLSDAVAFFGSILAESGEAVDRGDYRLFASHVSGPSGARLLGRFAHLDPALGCAVAAHLQAEEALRPDAVFAEIVHLPQGRIGNVIARPRLRDREIPYLGRGSAPPADRLEPSDLHVSVRRGRVTLRSARLGREVLPRLSSAHNYHTEQELPVYRFLCTLQDHGHLASASWDWGAQRSAAFLPRVTRGRLVLSPATWNLPVREVETISAAEGRHEAGAVDAWRRARGVPRFAVLVQGDNRLPVDFENPASALVFARLLRGRTSATLVEASHLGRDALCVRGPEGSFTHEVIIPLIRRAPVAATESRMQGRASAAPAVRVHPPGSEWLYARLYCGRGSADRILRQVVAPVVARARAEVPLGGWFFLRYADPDFHLRLRLRAPPADVPRLVEIVGVEAAPLVASGRLARLVYDTYLPEVERYGGPAAIGVAEDMFMHDSEAALALVCARGGSSPLAEVPWDLAVLAGIDRLLEDAGLPLETRIPLLDRAAGDVPRAIRHARGMEFRRVREAVTAVLAGGEAARAVRPLLDARSEGVRSLLNRLRALESEGELETPFD